MRPRILDWVARLANEGFLDDEHFIRARVFGAVYGTQLSVIDEIVDDAIAMAVVVLHERDAELGHTAVRAVDDAEEAVTALGDLATGLAQAAGAETEAPRATARDLGFGKLDGHFRDWLAKLTSDKDPEEYRREWQCRVHSTISRIADRLVNEAGEAAWTGRVTEAKSGSLWLTASRADLRFRAELRKALPMSTTEQTGEAPA